MQSDLVRAVGNATGCSRGIDAMTLAKQGNTAGRGQQNKQARCPVGSSPDTWDWGSPGVQGPQQHLGLWPSIRQVLCIAPRAAQPPVSVAQNRIQRATCGTGQPVAAWPGEDRARAQPLKCCRGKSRRQKPEHLLIAALSLTEHSVMLDVYKQLPY